MQRIDIGDGVELALDRRGTGPIPLVFVHGYSLSAESWERALPFFADERYTVLAYDLRGFGRSSKPPAGYTMRQHALDLESLLDRLGIEKAALIGHSLGGAISQEFATLRPQRLHGYVSCGAFARFNPLPGLDDAKRKRIGSFGTLEQNREVLAGAVERYVDPRNSDCESLDRFIGIALQASTAALRDQLTDAYTAPTLDVALYEALTIPVLAMSGATDAVVPVAQAIDLSNHVPDSELVLTPRAGHTPMWETPEAWSRAVRDFLDRRVLPAGH